MFRSLVKEKLLEVPRFASVYRKGKFYPVDKEDIDFDYHLVEKWKDETVSMEKVTEFMGTLYDPSHYDYSKPWWKFFYIPKLEDGRCLLMPVINHTLCDGVAGIALIYKLIDNGPDMSKPMIRDKKQGAKPKKKKVSYLNWYNRIGWFLWGISDGLTGTIDFNDSKSSLRMKNVLKASSDKRFAFTSPISLEKIKTVKSKFPGATVNDVLVAVLSMTIIQYLKNIDDPVLKKRSNRIRGNFPVNLRDPKKPILRDGDTSNDWGVASFRFPLKYKSRVDCFYKVKKQLDGLKSSPAPIVQKYNIKSLYGKFSPIPGWFVRDRLLALNSKVTTMISNVPGPAKEESMCGQRLDDIQFILYSPVGMYMGVLSYNGKVSVR